MISGWHGSQGIESRCFFISIFLVQHLTTRGSQVEDISGLVFVIAYSEFKAVKYVPVWRQQRTKVSAHNS